ncbi:MAG: hypothetical protein ACFE8J_12705 [Candidatus Heimdallarchaeota archaeon]
MSSIIYFFHYRFIINFDSGITYERERIIEFLANYVMFEELSDFLIIILGWILASLLPIFILKNAKKACIMNLTTLFFPNFFFYVFLFRYSPQYFTDFFSKLFFKTFILSLLIVFFSIGLSLILLSFKHFKIEVKSEEIEILLSKVKIKCPRCGTEFNSTPQFCYECNTDLTKIIED